VRAWVTGATGQIGFRLCEELERLGHEVTAIGRESAQRTSSYKWIDWDMSKGAFDIENVAPPDVVFHLAAQTSAYVAREDVPADVMTNVMGFVKLLDSLRKTGSRPHVISTGAATEVRVDNAGVVRDLSPDAPTTFYDVSKISQHLYLQQCDAEGWVAGTTIRLPNVYGGVRRVKTTDRGFLNSSVLRALKGEPLNYYSDGNYIRDYLHVDDVASALVSAMSHRDSVAGETFLIGTGFGTRIRDALREISRQVEAETRVAVPVLPITSPAYMYEIERRDCIVDSSRFTEVTSWTSTVGLEDGLHKTILDFMKVP